MPTWLINMLSTVGAGVVLAAVLGLWRLNATVNRLEGLFADVVKRLGTTEARTDVMPQMQALIDELRRGFHELKDAVVTSNRDVSERLRDHGERLATLGTSTPKKPRRGT